MGFFSSTPKETTKINVEIFNGLLEKAAIVDNAKKEFAEVENLKEAAFITKGASEKVWAMAKDKLNFDLNISDEFCLSYVIFFNNDNKIVKIMVVVSGGIEEDFAKYLEDNNYILRIQK